MDFPNASGPAVAVLPWGDIIEDALDPLSLSLDQLIDGSHGSWFFGFCDALARAGVRPILVFVSSRVAEPTRVHSDGMPAAVWVLPQPRRAAVARRCVVDSRHLLARLYNAPFRRARPYLATPLRALAAVLRDEGCTAILCQEYEYPRFDVCVLFGHRLGVPVFGTFQGITRTSNRFEGVVRRVTMRRAAGFVVGSEQEAARIQGRYGVPERRIALIGNPLDTQYWRPISKQRARAELGISAEALVVGWHGRVEVGTKGLDLLLSAWEQVIAAAPIGSRQLLLLGSGEDSSKLRAMLRRLDPRTVSWRSEFVPRPDEVRTFLSAADLYVLPSRREGTPVAALEAMSCGLPVVATTTARAAGYLRLGDGRLAGIEVPPEAADIADALRRLLEDADLRRRTSGWAREQAEATFDTEVIAPRLASFLTGGVSQVE